MKMRIFEHISVLRVRIRLHKSSMKVLLKQCTCHLKRRKHLS